jgi:hypothetical protein
MSERPAWTDRLYPTLVSMVEQYSAVVRDFTDQVLREGELPALLELMADVENKVKWSSGSDRIVFSFALLAMGERIEQALREAKGGSGEQGVE